MTTDKDFWAMALTVVGGVATVVWGFTRWLSGKVSLKLAKIDELDTTINNLKPKLQEFSTTLSNLSASMVAVNKDIDKRLLDGDKRFADHELRFERARLELLESMNAATSEARQFHDQANDMFVRKEDLKANIIMVAGEYCNDNCRDRKERR